MIEASNPRHGFPNVYIPFYICFECLMLTMRCLACCPPPPPPIFLPKGLNPDLLTGANSAQPGAVDADDEPDSDDEDMPGLE